MSQIFQTCPQRGVAFVGNYPPRRCGIASFTFDLAESVSDCSGKEQPVIVAAMNDVSQGYDYPERVKFEIRQEHLVDFTRAADYLNFSRYDVVCLQHEYGIFGGGQAGPNILTLLRELRRPLVVTCHTVLKEPPKDMFEVFSEIAARAAKLVVMSQKAVGFLKDVYGVDEGKIACIPHGIHDTPFIDPGFYKDKFGVEGRRVLFTFGLLHRNKGIEYMIDALPAVVDKHPNVTYLVLGATHPAVYRKEGEAYRLELQRRARDLGVGEHVLFHPRFVELDELLEYLGAADVFVTPYLIMEQITSGVLSYAMGAGKAVVSTPYWHAEELLGEGRGRLVPPRDPKALAREINDLLDDEMAFNTMRKAAYLHSRSAVWSVVARKYLELFDEARRGAVRSYPIASAMRRPLAASNLPAPRFEHVQRLTDSTGITRFARRGVPDWRHGYYTADAALALVVSTKFAGMLQSKKAENAGITYLSLLQHLLTLESVLPPRRLTYARLPDGEIDDGELGQVVWALGYVVRRGSQLVFPAANDLFDQIVPAWEPGTVRGAAYATLGASNYLQRFPGASSVRRYLTTLVQFLAGECSSPNWMRSWAEADWPVAVQALAVASSLVDNRIAPEMLENLTTGLLEYTSRGTRFVSLTETSLSEELPQTAAAFIEAVGALHERHHRPRLVDAVRSAADWFLGANRRGEHLYDFTTGGCFDALSVRGVNKNQGAQSTLWCLMAFLTLHELTTATDSARGPEA